LMMSLWDALRMNMMISYQELVRTFPSFKWLRSHFLAHPRNSSLPNPPQDEEGQHRAWQTSDNVVLKI
ncbi:hypothetical protein, partial [Escherichia coli]